ncbi:MAG: S49 family peptidase [Thermofilum sp.]
MRKARWILAAVLVALALAAASAVLYPRLTGVVAVIRVSGYILTSEDADYYTALIHRAYTDERVGAVVLVVDSFGGSADYVEQVYYSLKQLKTRKPVVAVAVNALSGGYYICAAADYIFAHPTSLVGSIGVIATAPPILIPSEAVLETGPYKLTAFSRLHFFSNLSRALDAFISAVQEGRGERLKASREELSRALVYLGSEALKLGLVDQLGSVEQAVEEAARRTGLLRYTVEELKLPNATVGSLYGWRNVTASLLASLHPPPAVYYIYLPPGQLAEKEAASLQPATGPGRVVVDLSHGNRVSWWSLDALLAELAKLNVTVGFLDTWDRVRRELANASALIVAAPTRPYTSEEVKEVEEFVKRGGVLLLLYDPAYEYIGYEGLSNYITAPINSLASRFGVTFAYGYLYSPSDHFGFYRNVYVRRFTNASVFSGVRELMLLTATAVRSRHEAAWVPSGTILSVAEEPGEYAVAALLNWGNGTVLALGDITLFTEPFCRLADNSVFIRNLARLIANATPARVQVKEQRLERPVLPVGTVKVFEVREDGEAYAMTWRRVGENEVIVETPYYTARYFYVDGKLKEWEADGVKCTYDEPLPEPPFPLARGSSWNYSAGFTLIVEGREYRGLLEGREVVESFENVTALDGRTYFCASIRLELVERFSSGGITVVTITRGYYWVSADAGLVKQSTTTKRSYDSETAGFMTREITLKELRKPASG